MNIGVRVYWFIFFLKDDLWLLTEQTAEDLFVSFAFISYDPQIAHADCDMPFQLRFL